MSKTYCQITTPEIRELTNKIVGETEESIKGLVALWRDKNNKSLEDYPTARELVAFRDAERKTEDATQMLDEALGASFDAPKVSALEQQRKVDLDFDPKTRRDRVTLISRLFSQTVTSSLQEKQTKLTEQINTASGDRVTALQSELNALDRFKIISELSPAGVFKKVREVFSSYVEASEEDNIKEELGKINALKAASKYTEEQKLAAAKKRASYKREAYNKILDNFEALAEEASGLLITSEGIRVNLDYMAPSDANLNDDTPEGESETDNDADDFNKDEAFKDGWMTNFKHVSSHESLSQAVRKVISEVPKLDYKGHYEKDDLGFNRYLDANYVHATLVDKLRDMIDSTDMIPLLNELVGNKPWVKQIIKLLQSDEVLYSQFYQDFRKDFVPYWIQKRKTNADGSFKVETVAVNKPEGVYYLLDAWRDNYEQGNLLDEDSIYEKNGDINIENAEKGLALVEDLTNKFNNHTTEERLAILEDEAVWNSIMKGMHMLGIDANPSVLKNALTDIKQAPGIKFTDPIMLLLPQMNVIFRGVKKGEVKSETKEDGTEKKGDLINTFGSAYNSIALMMATVTEDAIESSVRENDKSYYSHVTPNYLGKLIKQLKNVRGDKTRFDEFINKEFKAFEWFFKDGQWRNDWIQKLVEDAEMRKALSHKVLLNYDKKIYQDWDDLDYTLVLLNEYWAEPKESMAWYHVPILSDSPSAEFIRFVRYTTGSEIDENGNKRTYDDIILDHLTDLVNQEYDRIMLVRERDAAFQAGENIAPIANYDISRDSKGNIKNIGGAEFKFLPALNSFKRDNETFLDAITRLKKGSGADLRNYIRQTLTEVMDDEFEKVYRDWCKIGLMDELPSGKLQNLPFQGPRSSHQKVARALNTAKEKLGARFTPQMDNLIKNLLNDVPVTDKTLNSIINDVKALLHDATLRGELEANESETIQRNLTVKNNAKEALREYFWNSKHATSQIIQLTTTDLAFYKNVEDFQKRYKEVHAPALRLNTKATFRGEVIGREVEKTIYLQDDEIVSSALSDIEQVLKSKGMGQAVIDNILSQFKKVNVADAQAYRSLSSYRAILGMSGQWTDEMEKAYKNFQSGNWDLADFYTIWQTKKPYVYTQVNNESGVEGHTGIKTPVQHKNSEFLLLAMHELVAGPLGKSSKLRAINEFMEKHGIDVVQFESTTKVGKQGIINLNAVNSFEDVTRVLENATGVNTTENPNVVHKVPYEDYGIQTATPEHAIDASQLVGTQIRKLITADIDPNTTIEVNGKKMTKQEWLDLYNAINTENILQKFVEVDEIFKDPKEVEKILLEEIRGNQRYGQDMIKACTLDEKGNFNIPLYDPVQSQRIQTLLNSIIKSRVTKQKIRGGALIQVSSYGLTDDLQIVYEGEGANKHIKYLECYMPAYSRDFYEPLMDPDTHQLDVTKLPEDLRKLIGYRVPTEDKYSMAPLYIKGFLPQQNGSAIMLPAEITTLSGSDFDVDKMYIMLPEFRVQKYDMRKAREDYAREDAIFKELLSSFTNSDLAEDLLANDSADFKSWFKEHREEYKLKTPRIAKVKYNFDKSPQENSLEARNNLLIDLMYGVLTNSDTAPKILNPGGFDYQKKAARISTILSSVYESELEEALKKEGIKMDKMIKRGDRMTKAPITSYLLDLPLSSDDKSVLTLDKLVKSLVKQLDPLSPRTQVVLHQQNMTGAKMIGIYANHNANHALMQHTLLGVDAENGSFVLNGKRLTSLHNMTNDAGEFISRNTANFLAASVDNVKDNTLHATNQNTFTGDASMLLSRLGYNPVEIAILMGQPIVRDITQAFFREGGSKGKDSIIDEVLGKYREKASLTRDLTYDSYKGENFYIEELAENILIAKEVEAMADNRNTPDFRKVQFYQKQVAVGFLFKKIMGTSEALGSLVQATRADTQGGAAGPTIADTMSKLQKVEDLMEAMSGEKYPLANAGVITDMRLAEGESIDEFREKLLKSPLPFLQAFYSLGIRQTEALLQPYFPQYTESFRNVVDSLRAMTKTGRLNVKTMNSIYNDLLAYIMSKTAFFGSEANGDTLITSNDKRKDFINKFPDYFKKTVTDNEDIADLEFIKRLKIVRANDHNPVSTVVFKNVGQLSPTLRERYMRDWATLLYMPNPEAQKLALNLFRYSFYRNGFAFGPSTFIHLAPTAVRTAIPQYINTLRSLLTSADDYSEFVDQYVYNHLDNRKLVPEIDDNTTVKFLEDNDIKDEVVFEITDDSTYSDKRVIKEKIKTDDGVEYDFIQYIGKRLKGRYIYYRLASANGNVATYQRIEPLGFRNSFIEYEYGKSAEEVSTVIDKNKVDYNPYAEALANFATEPEIDYDSMPDYDIPALSDEYLASAFQGVYGEMPDLNLPAPDDMTSMEPNNEYTDAEGNPICGGAPTLFSL